MTSKSDNNGKGTAARDGKGRFGKGNGGRPKGSRNKLTVTARERIAREADPIGLLIDVAKGNPIQAAKEKDTDDVALVRPTLEQRIAAAQMLARKVAPDMKAIEVDGSLGIRHEDTLAALE